MYIYHHFDLFLYIPLKTEEKKKKENYSEFSLQNPYCKKYFENVFQLKAFN